MTTLPDVPGLASMPAAVRRRLAAICAELGLSCDHIAATIAHESGWRPDAVNPTSGATGLIQFMPATAEGLGTTTAALRRMSALEQLEYVRKYFLPVAPLAPRDVALAVFLPSAIGRPDGAVLFERGQPGYDQNAALDADGDGAITAGEVRARVDRLLEDAATRPRLELEPMHTPSPAPPRPPPPTRSSAPLWGILWLLTSTVVLGLAVRR